MQNHAGPGGARRFLDPRRRIYREALWIGSAQLATIAARLVAVKLLTTLLVPERYGELALLLGLATLGLNAFFQPTQFAATKYYPDALLAGRVGSLRRIALDSLRRRASLLVGSSAIVALVGPLVGLSGKQSLGLIAAALLLSIDARRLLELNLLNVARRQTVYSLWTAADAWARALLAPLAVVLVARVAAPALAGEALACAILYLAFRRFSVTGEPEAIEDPAWCERLRSDMIAYGRPMIALAAIGWITSVGDRYVVAAFGGTAQAGFYAAAYGLASQPFLALAGIGFSVFRPLLFEAVSRGDRRRERQVLAAWSAVYGAIAVLGGIVLVLARELVVHLAIGPQFWEGASALVPWIALAFCGYGFHVVAEARLYAQGRTNRILVAQSIGAAVSLLGYVTLVPRWGALGAAWACVASRWVSCVAVWALSSGATAAGSKDSAPSAPSVT